MLKPTAIVLISCCLLLHSCLSNKDFNRFVSKENSKDETVIRLNEVKITPKRNDEFRTVAPKLIDLIHTDLDVSFNWGKHECIGKETLLIKPYFYATDSIVLDAKNMIFGEILITDTENLPVQYLTNYDKKNLVIKLERKISAQDTLKIVIKYTAKPDEAEGLSGNAIKNDKGMYFINTNNSDPYKPVQIWTQGEVEASSCWFPTIDKPNEKFTIKLSITVNKDLTTLSNGELVSSTVNGILKTDIWESTKPLSAYLVMMAIGNFNITNDYLSSNIKDSFVTVTYDTIHLNSIDSTAIAKDSIIQTTKMNYRNATKDLLNGVKVSYYLEPKYSPYALNIFKHSPEMIDFFSAKLGVEYPWKKYAQIVVYDFIAGAMENVSATIHNEYVQKNNRQLLDATNDDIIAHELFHQWFGNLVTCKSWSHLVLNEGFATYGELLWLEYKYGSDAALLESYNTLNRYLFYSRDNNDEPIIQFNYKNPDDMFSVITYQKGALVLHLLRNELGDEAFFLSLKNYLNRYSYDNAEIDDLRREFENVSGKDLRNFFNQWFYKGGHPILEVRYDYNDSTKLMGITIEQKQSSEIGLFKFPLAFKVTQANQTKYFNFQIEKKIETFYVQKFDTSFNEFPNVFVDPHATFVGEIKDNKPFVNHIKTYHNATNFIEKIRSLKALSELKNSLDTARSVLLTAINDKDAEIRSNAIEWTNWSDAKNVMEAKSLLISIAQTDISIKVRAKATKALSDLKDATLFNTLSDLTNDSSYKVASNALYGIYKLIPDEALRLSQSLEKDAGQELFERISIIYSLVGKQQNVSFFETNLLKVFGRKRVLLIDDYADFCVRINQQDIYDKAYDNLMDRVVNDKNSQIRVASLSALNAIYQKQLSDNSIEKDVIKKNERQMALLALKENIQKAIDQEKDLDAINMLKIKGLSQTHEVVEDR